MTTPNTVFAEAVSDFYHGEWGFTGTRAGMSVLQSAWMRRILTKGEPLILRHGGAHGADTEVHELWRESKLPGLVEVWPEDPKRRRMFMHHPNVHVKAVMDPLTRNLEIIKRSSFLVATPHRQYEEQRSGTWMTLRHAFARDLSALIVWPNGHLTLYRAKHLHRVV